MSEVSNQRNETEISSSDQNNVKIDENVETVNEKTEINENKENNHEKVPEKEENHEKLQTNENKDENDKKEEKEAVSEDLNEIGQINEENTEITNDSNEKTEDQPSDDKTKDTKRRKSIQVPKSSITIREHRKKREWFEEKATPKMLAKLFKSKKARKKFESDIENEEDPKKEKKDAKQKKSSKQSKKSIKSEEEQEEETNGEEEANVEEEEIKEVKVVKKEKRSHKKKTPPPPPPKKVVKKAFVYPLRKSVKEPTLIKRCKISNQLEKIVRELLKKWRNGKNAVVVDDNAATRLDILSCTIVSIQDTVENVPPALIICHESSSLEWIEAIRGYAPKLTLAASSKTECDESVLKENKLPTRKKDVNFDIFLVSCKHFLEERKSIPDITYSSVIVDNFLFDSPEIDKSELKTKVKKLDTLQLTLGCGQIDDYKIQDIQLLAAAITGKRGNSSTRNVIKTILSQYQVTNEKHTEVKPKKEVKKKEKKVNRAKMPTKEDLIFCPMTEYQISVYKSSIWSLKNFILLDTLLPESWIELASNLFTACNHPMITDHHFIEDKDFAENITNQSGKLIFLEKFLMKKTKGEKVVVICEDDESVDLLNTSFLPQGIKASVIVAKTPEGYQKNIIDDFQNSESSILIIEELIIDSVLSKVEPTIIITFDSFWKPIVSQSIFSVYPEIPRFIRLITENSVDDDLFRSSWHNKRFVEDKMLAYETADLDRIKKIIRHSALFISEATPAKGFSWWLDTLNNTKTVVYGDKSTLEPFDSMSVHGSDFWSTIFPEGVTKETKNKKKEAEWTVDSLRQLIECIRSFGINRWGKVDLKCSETQLRRAIDFIFIKLEKLFKPTKLKNAQEVLYSIANVSVSSSSITPEQITEALGGATAEEFFNDFECSTLIQQIIEYGTNSSRISHKIDPPAKDWTQDDDFKLIQSAYDIGLLNINDDIHTEAVGLLPYLKSIVPFYGSNLKARRTKDSHNSSKAAITPEDHKNIIERLVHIGLPDINKFMDHPSFSQLSPDVVSEYIDCILTYCDAVHAHVKGIQGSLLVSRITKYMVDSIPDRLSLFEKCRELGTSLSDVCAEDIELALAIAYHGTTHYTASITLLSHTQGNLTGKVLKRLRDLVGQYSLHSGSAPIKNGVDVRAMLPVRFGDQIICEEIGKIDQRKPFSNNFAVYPIGYRVKVVTNDIKKVTAHIFVYCSIEEEDGKPVFIITTPYYEDLKLKGSTPQEVWDEYRKVVENNVREFVPSFYGDEMFGFISPLYHKMLFAVLEDTDCPSYVRRIFRDSTLEFSSKPIEICVYSEIPEVKQNAAPAVATPAVTMLQTKFHFNFSLLNDSHKDATLTMSAPSVPFMPLLNFYNDTEEKETTETPQPK